MKNFWKQIIKSTAIIVVRRWSETLKNNKTSALVPLELRTFQSESEPKCASWKRTSKSQVGVLAVLFFSLSGISVVSHAFLQLERIAEKRNRQNEPLEKNKTSNSQLSVLVSSALRERAPQKQSVLDAMITRKEVKNVDVQSS